MLHESDLCKLLQDYFVKIDIPKSYKILDTFLLDDFSIKILYQADDEKIYCTLPIILNRVKNDIFKDSLFITTSPKKKLKIYLFENFVVEVIGKEIQVISFKDDKKLKTFSLNILASSWEQAITLKKKNMLVLSSTSKGVNVVLLKEYPEVLSSDFAANYIAFSPYSNLFYGYRMQKIVVADILNKKGIKKEFSLPIKITAFSIYDKNTLLLSGITPAHELNIYLLADSVQILRNICLNDMIPAKEVSVFAEKSFIFLKDIKHNYYLIDYEGRWIMVKKSVPKVVCSHEELIHEKRFIIEIIEHLNETRIILWSPCNEL